MENSVKISWPRKNFIFEDQFPLMKYRQRRQYLTSTAWELISSEVRISIWKLKFTLKIKNIKEIFLIRLFVYQPYRISFIRFVA